MYPTQSFGKHFLSTSLPDADLIGDILHPGYPTDHSFQTQFIASILYHPVKGNDEPTGTDVYPVLYALSSETGTNESCMRWASLAGTVLRFSRAIFLAWGQLRHEGETTVP